MPMYYFHLYDDVLLRDDDGTELIDLPAARDHAAGVARELTFKSASFMQEAWSNCYEGARSRRNRIIFLGDVRLRTGKS